MPTYEYLCQQCGERLEVFQKFTAKPLRVHAECGGALQKVFHASGVVFKGSGYYVNDSRASASNSQSAKKDSAAASSNGKSDSSSNGNAKKSDSKSDSKSGSKSDSKSTKSSESTAAAD
jgi:putative FmdB family regulatory protein